MRCKACDKLLSDAEARRKCPHTNLHIDLCSTCGKLSWLTENFEDFDAEFERDETFEELQLFGVVTLPKKVEY